MAIDRPRLVESILNQDRSLLLRALDLYELQVGLYRTDRSAKRARKFAAIKLLECIEPRSALPGFVIDVSKPLHCLLWNEIFAGGFLGLRRLPSDRAFDRRLKKERARASFAANVVDVLHRCSGDKKTSEISLSNAMFVVRKGYRFNGQLIYGKHGGKTTEKKNWADFVATSVFMYLLEVQSQPLRPHKLATKGFAKNLLEQAGNEEILRAFFHAHDEVVGVLNRFRFAKLLPRLLKETLGQVSTPTLRQRPIEPELMRLIKSYTPGID